MADEKSKLTQAVEFMTSLWGSGDPPTPPPVAVDTAIPAVTPTPEAVATPSVAAPVHTEPDPRIAALEAQVVQQTEAMRVLAQRPEGVTTSQTPIPTAPPAVKRSLRVSAAEELGTRIAHELLDTPEGQQPFDIHYKNPNKWALP